MFPFKLSEWQQESINALKNGNNSLVTAPTGSGKSVPFEFAVQHFVPQGKKVIYTSPIKALSNQKFYELQNKFPDFSFGIITGDIKFNPEADVIIMTTEILRNNLYLMSTDSPNQLDFNVNIEKEVGCIVFDEVHYINDKDRGTIWEECFILAPKTCQLLMLSATIAAPEKFADWVSGINPDKTVVHSDCKVRSVPLEHYLWISCYENKIEDKKKRNYEHILNKPLLFRDSKGNFNDKNYHSVNNLQSYIYNNRIFIKRIHVYNELVKHLQENNLLPAINFIYSRKEVEKLANSMQCRLLSTEESQKAEKEAQSIVRKLPNGSEFIKMPQFQQLVRLVERGIGIHHSGMLPILRETVELLFDKGYIKLLFATETFAVGINMPTKTAIFSDMSKFDGSVRRYLEPHEYTQQAGRAGRRGYDTKGYVIHLCNLFEMPIISEYKHILSNKPQTLRSKFCISYHLILNTIKNKELESISASSLMNTEIQNELVHHKNDLTQTEIQLNNYKNNVEHLRTPKNILNEYIELNDILSISTNKTKKNALRNINYMKQENKFIEDDFENYKKGLELELKREIQINGIESTANYMKAQSDTINSILVNCGLITIENEERHLTDHAELALMVKEANCLTLTQLMIDTNFFESLTALDLGGLFSCYASYGANFDDCEVTNIRGNDNLWDTIYALKKINEKYLETETNNQIYSELSYQLCFDWTDLINEWCKAESEDECQDIIRKSTKIFPGEFLKTILKVHNITKEVSKIAEDKNIFSLLEKTKELSGKLIKSVMTNHSLYV